ncbi:MAG: GerMN domain-containing protein, partial [Actinobacteria bacterium]|nr:GerMN domain-containing protein [Actinomycetota bacterium]
APQGGSGTNCCALDVSGPRPGWSPAQIVAGFLLASTSFTHGTAIARQYLTPGASKSWSPGPAVTIVDQPPTVISQPSHESGLDGTVTVVASGREIAKLSGSGQYKPVTRSGTARFVVTQVRGQWRIAQLPGPHVLLLPKGLFNLVYKPQNLYFYARSPAGHVLVPDPVFVPSDSTDPATRLVTALMNGIPEWLRGAASSAIPQQARLLGVQVLPGPPENKTAVVSLRLPPGTVRQATVRALDAQLVWTLTSSSYGEPLVGSVKLKVNGHFWPASGSAVLGQSRYRDMVPEPAGAQNLYFVGADGRVRVLGQAVHGGNGNGTPVPGVAGQGQVPMSAIAVSPDRSRLAGVSADGKTVYVSDLAAGAAPHAGASATTPRPRITGSRFTTPSWDQAGDLWVAGAGGIYVLPRGATAPQRVSLPPGLGPVTALRIAPDGVRAAMIAGRGAAAHLVIAAIIRAAGQFAILDPVPVGPNVTAPSALTWYDADHLLAATGSPRAVQVWEVPVNGNGAVSQGAPQPGIVSIAAAGPDNPLYLGLASGRLERSAGFGEFWSDVSAGRAATYPG